MSPICGSRLKRFCFWALTALVTGGYAVSQTAISASEAKNHIGEQSKVCGPVASTHFAYRSRGAPTFINLDRPYPNQIFTAVIWREDRAKFGSPETRYANQQICVTGVIEAYRGTPEIIVRNPSQIEVKKKHE